MLIFGCVQCGPFTATVTPSTNHFKVGQDVLCEVTITNQDSEDRFLFTRGTPLEKFKSNIFLVIQNMKPIPYNALHFKSGTINKYSNGINIPPKQSVAVTVDLSSAYSFKTLGNYSVSLNTIVYFLDKEENVEANHLFSVPSKFEVSGGGVPKLTIAEKLFLDQAQYDTLPAVSMDIGGKPMNLTFDGKYDSFDISNATDAWANAYKAVVASPADMDNNTAHYKTWFGAVTHKDTAKGNIQDIQKAMETLTYILFFRGPECIPGDEYAYTFFGSTTIYLCDLYFEAKDSSDFDTKFGIFVNKLSQAVDNNDDKFVGIDHCKNLAQSKPQQAVRNAANYQYFVETLQFGKKPSLML